VRAKGEMTSVCVRLSTMKAVEIPDEVREKLGG
jgi:acyl-CoA thioesterase FadM